MTQDLFKHLQDGITKGTIIPYLGSDALTGSVSLEDQSPIPADSDSLIYAMNDGRPMAPKLMWEFARAAMNLELKKGRSFITKFLNKTYGEKKWTRSPTHDWLQTLMLPYVIDINRDLQLQDTYKDTPHNLIRGCARLGGTDYRFVIHAYDGTTYTEIGPEDMNMSLPCLFKPMGSPLPTATYIASDADFVDYITELMGGFAIPNPIKEYRKEKQYLFMGLRFTRDTERMVMSDIIYSAAPTKGWALLPNPSEKEIRFCKKMNIEVIDASIMDFLSIVAPSIKGVAA
jgi:hypothetical protein